jgi:hypothetical protein
MRALLTALVLIILPGSAQTANWEGKDDRMADIEPAVIYENSAPHARPLAGPGLPGQAGEQGRGQPL